jgi:hypothetical protein
MSRFRTVVLDLDGTLQRGTGELLRLLRGLISGFGAFPVFCFTLAVSLPPLDTGAAFALATVLALETHAMVFTLVRGEPTPQALPEY